MIVLEKVNKYYKLGKGKFHALKDISLTVQDGEFVSIEGESGAGKSTLLHIIGLLDTFESGSYFLDGTDVKGLKDGPASRVRNERVGFVMQDFSLIPGKSVLFNTMLPLLFSKNRISFRTVKKRALKMLERVGISDQANKKVSQLSGGQRQRVAIARAMMAKPSVILADEPTGALDTKTTGQIMELLKSVNEKEKITVIVVTHSKTVSDYCNRRIIMSDGEIISDTERPRP